VAIAASCREASDVWSAMVNSASLASLIVAGKGDCYG